MHSKGFAAFAHKDARVLILGSLPGRMSLQEGQYYAQPRNAFWSIMGELFGALPELPYEDRIACLTRRGIALWDVCAEGCRAGSLDSAIEPATIVPNDFAKFFKRHKAIRLICFNGSKAYEIYRRKVLPILPEDVQNIRYEVLPSTSPAHAGMSFERKLSRWRSALGTVLSVVPLV